ncbi:MAG: electron transfer flavoprotein subunit beta/FixA family protein [Candidatus Thermoplasmatota archaeon]|nr:electron transfer flavoprotein subunit beta/FixA family protein [Candidatus Thermoplasmatota archaeon]
MNIVVCAKEVVDVSEIKIDEKTNKPILEGISREVSDIEKSAVEEAIKIKEEYGGEITILTVGSVDNMENVKELLAMGADEAVIISPPEEPDYTVVTELLAGAIKEIGDIDLVLCGEASIDLFSGQVGPRIAELLDIPQITYAEGLEVEEEKIVGERDVGGNKIMTVESPYPVLVTVTKEINDPRLPSLQEILGAANKPINEWEPEKFMDHEIESTTETKDIRGVSMERKNIIFDEDELEDSVKNLAENLAKEGLLEG